MGEDKRHRETKILMKQLWRNTFFVVLCVYFAQKDNTLKSRQPEVVCVQPPFEFKIQLFIKKESSSKNLL